MRDCCGVQAREEQLIGIGAAFATSTKVERHSVDATFANDDKVLAWRGLGQRAAMTIAANPMPELNPKTELLERLVLKGVTIPVLKIKRQ